MALLDVFRNIGEKMGKGMERNIGGLLGVDPEDMTEAEKKQARRLSQMAVFDALARGTTPTAGLQGAAALLGAQREERSQRQRQQAAEQEMGRITGRLFGGAPAAPEGMGADETGLGPVAIQSQYRKNPQEALARMYGTSAGRDVAQMAPGLLKLAEEGAAPDDYVYQSVSGVGLVAVNKKDPKDVRIVQSERQRAAGPRETFKILSPEEVKANNLRPGVIYQQNMLTKQITPMQGGEAGGLSDTDVRQYRASDLAIKDARSSIQNLTDTISRVPAYKALAAEGRGELQGAYTLALGAVRELQNTGVLNASEMPFLEKALGDPTTFFAIAASPIKRKELAGQIKTIMKLLDKKEKNLQKSYFPGQPTPQNEPSPAVTPSVPGNPRRAPSPESANRAESYY